ncbi:MAG: hypothetical protein Q4B22_00175 [Eubacteriales bacterium]|nr:hypothetical protein [Eubacteriales bacterium]
MDDLLLLLLLVPNAYEDQKRMEILPAYTGLLGVIGLLHGIGGHTFCMENLLPGLLFLGFSLAGAEVGAGDGIVLLAAGCCTDLVRILQLLCFGCVLCFSYGMLTGRRQLPFIPFVLVGFLLSVLLELL